MKNAVPWMRFGGSDNQFLVLPAAGKSYQRQCSARPIFAESKGAHSISPLLKSGTFATFMVGDSSFFEFSISILSYSAMGLDFDGIFCLLHAYVNDFFFFEKLVTRFF